MITIRRDPTPMELMQQAVSAGVTPETVKQFMDLQHEWATRRAEAEFAVAMSDCQGEMPPVVKDKKNDHTKTMYARLEVVNTVIKPIYTKHGFSVTFSERDPLTPGHCRVVATVRHDGGHKEEHFTELPLDGVGARGNSNMTGVQGKGSTIAYARRYLCLMIFNVTVVDEDQDGNSPNSVITAEQLGKIHQEISKREQAGIKMDDTRMKRLLKYAGVEPGESLKDMKQSMFEGVMKVLSQTPKENDSK